MTVDAEEDRPESALRAFRRRFVRKRLAVGMAVVLAVLVLIAVFGPWLTPQDPNAQKLLDRLAPPGAEHWLGTDDLGRDVASRLIVATRVTIYAGALATAVSLAIGLPFGLLAGYLRGWVDAVLSRVADALMAIPPLLFALAILAVLGRGVTNAMIAVGVTMAPQFYRVSRGVALAIREETFIEAARSIGCPTTRIMRTHVLPNMLSPLIVQVSMTMGFAILIEASLSFLGLGVQAPDASWGSMLQRSTQFAAEAPWLVLLPGFAILLSVLAFNTVGDALRDSVGRENRRLG
ncbi:ABC transporter permease [Saccharothrix sp. NRRL B-16314]|uniref:ABC transporter permease n=1 Tax=Saccharothrix sp. NRRL B-16314 TaxID=1463825 RepID=UPI0005251295|nr:ABC transporter permease [Saccharothrix sp. NRRL B-16314]